MLTITALSDLFGFGDEAALDDAREASPGLAI